jgi:hypothetical protein
MAYVIGVVIVMVLGVAAVFTLACLAIHMNEDAPGRRPAPADERGSYN